MTDTATLQARLAEAETARHKLMIGQIAATVSTDGDSVTYTRASLPNLERYIHELRLQLQQTKRISMRPQ